MSDILTAPATTEAAATPDATLVPASGQVEQKPIGAWYESIADESLRGYAENKKFASVEDVLKSHQHHETLLGDNVNNVKVPASDAKPEEWAEFYSKTGRPAKADDYNLSLPQGADENFAKASKEMFYNAGLSAAQAEQVSKSYNEYVSNMQAQIEQNMKVQNETQLKELQQEWAGNYDRNIELARRAARSLGIDSDKANAIQNAIGLKEMVKLFNSIGSGFKEDTFIGSTDTGQFGMSVEAAREKIAELSRSETMRKAYLAQDPKVTKEIEIAHKVLAGAMNG